jgi:hypothetical protein
LRVLLVHPEDNFKDYAEIHHWDLVVDLARAPASCYEEWSRVADSRVVSLFDFAQGETDLQKTCRLLQAGMGVMVDSFGIDWWDVLSIMIVPELLQTLLVERLANSLVGGWELYATRPSPVASAIRVAVGGKLTAFEKGTQSVVRRVSRYGRVLRSLDAKQIFQVMQDKFDSRHELRRLFSTRPTASLEEVVLLPSAYVNVSRTSVAYAAELPSQQFLLVCARDSAFLREVPPNVRVASLTPYFVSPAEPEIELLKGLWERTKTRILEDEEEFGYGNSAHALDQIPSKLKWGIAIRNAWQAVFESQNIVSCLCADDSNPYTRIPLMLAEQRSLPTIACHHGALDFRVAIKQHHADYYLAKSDMERDYVERFGRIASEDIVVGAPRPSALHMLGHRRENPPWLVFFSEPLESWRTGEVYRELSPALMALAEKLQLQLVVKLHPFENVKTYRRLLRRYLGKKRADQVLVLQEPLSGSGWTKVAVAVAVQSTVALECARLGIPIFLCRWLENSYAAYTRQFVQFGAGRILESVVEIANIPLMLGDAATNAESSARASFAITPERLKRLLLDTRQDSHVISARRVGA